MAIEKNNSDPPLPPQPPVPLTGVPVPLGSEVGRYPDTIQTAPTRPGLKLAPSALVRAFAHRWLSALVLGLLLGGGAAAALWFLRPPAYTSYALIHIAPNPVQLLPSTSSELRPHEHQSYQKTQLALIKSRPIILAAFLNNSEIRHTELLRREANPEEWLEKELQVGFLEGTEFIRIALTGPNPNELPKVVNAIKDAYLEKADKDERTKQRALLGEIESVYSDSEERIRGKRENLEKLTTALGTNDSTALTIKQKTVLEEYAALKKEVASINAQLRQIQMKVLVQQGKGSTPQDLPIPESLVEIELDRDKLVQEAYAKVVDVEGRAEKTQGVLNEGGPQAERHKRRLAEDLAKAKAEHARIRAERRSKVIAILRLRVVEERRHQVGQLNDEQAILERQKEALQKEVDQIAKDAERIGTTSFELETKRKEIEQAEAVIRDLRQQKERLSVEIKGKQKRVSNWYDAEVPQNSNLKSRLQMAIVGGVGIFLLTCGLVSFLELRRQRIFSSEEVSQDLGIRVIGSLPNFPTQSGGVVRVRRGGVDVQAVFSESIDSIRAMLLCDDNLSTHRVLMVTSARSGEGKTTLACHLAASIARAGNRTLLVDCDFRRPAIHKLFGIPSRVGLSEIVTGEALVEEAVTPSPIDGLYILQAGVPRRETLSLLGKDTFRKTFEKLRGQYDFLVVDSCPVLPVADSLILGKHADSVVLSVRPHVSQAPLLAAAYERLTALHIMVLGVVVTGENLRSKTYGDLYPMLESQPK